MWIFIGFGYGYIIRTELVNLYFIIQKSGIFFDAKNGLPPQIGWQSLRNTLYKLTNNLYSNLIVLLAGVDGILYIVQLDQLVDNSINRKSGS